MKRIALANAAIVLLAILASCSKGKHALIYNTWQVESMKVHADSALQYPQNKKNTLSFENGNTCHLDLGGARDCWGDVKVRHNNSIKFSHISKCTFSNLELPKSASTFYKLIEMTNHYAISKNRLILSGDNGEIINFIKQ
ncbi:MAG: hypothetical protein LBH82_00825 [Bacteroidales bacterium]|jgi:hypothetical protein|nr:hypothetical protein [Bacteroidales bacterium]